MTNVVLDAPGVTRAPASLRAHALAERLEQGAAALECWFPGVDAPEEIMRAAVDAALR